MSLENNRLKVVPQWSLCRFLSRPSRVPSRRGRCPRFCLHIKIAYPPPCTRIGSLPLLHDQSASSEWVFDLVFLTKSASMWLNLRSPWPTSGGRVDRDQEEFLCPDEVYIGLDPPGEGTWHLYLTTFLCRILLGPPDMSCSGFRQTLRCGPTELEFAYGSLLWRRNRDIVGLGISKPR